MATATRLIQRLRNFLVGRNLQAKLNNRTVDEIASRTIPEPNLPEGCSHKLAANYYYTRDGRRELNPPTVVYSQTKLLQEPQQGESASSVAQARKVVTPGVMRQWKLSTDEPFL
ncbi:NADH dehydrogenase [ubiquinone] 1 alpha subcomplex subunit 7 [Holothuria leucospilota]|uniref:NADH dehydrogenase [ubiquinone] 1 alpha subcomplex subunit 7 n=1 Tax=Holothuria leucospilota TaxID=206669 RepID=A0A9Q1C6C9_HOLLE|nr:NADH dehydrogenase [ubiquinone] 1 alpha subcomplex subunit 7 [Holothuria leucospilota]